MKIIKIVAVVFFSLIIVGVISLSYAESTWNQVQYSGHVTSFYISQTISGWQTFPIPGNTTYYGMNILLNNGTSVHVELNGRCIQPGFGINSTVVVGYNTGLWNPQDGWRMIAPMTYYCQGIND